MNDFCPNQFKGNKPIRINVENLPPELSKLFIADGSADKVIKCRSLWHDWKELQSK